MEYDARAWDSEDSRCPPGSPSGLVIIFLLGCFLVLLLTSLPPAAGEGLWATKLQTRLRRAHW